MPSRPRIVLAAPPAGALPGALQRDGGDVFEGPAPSTPGGESPQLASCFWFVTIEGSPPGSAAGHVITAAPASQVSSAPGAPGTPGRSDKVVPAVRTLQAFASKAVPRQLAGLALGPLIGSGSFGRGEHRRQLDTVTASLANSNYGLMVSGRLVCLPIRLRPASTPPAARPPHTPPPASRPLLPPLQSTAASGTPAWWLSSSLTARSPLKARPTRRRRRHWLRPSCPRAWSTPALSRWVGRGLLLLLLLQSGEQIGCACSGAFAAAGALGSVCGLSACAVLKLACTRPAMLHEPSLRQPSLCYPAQLHTSTCGSPSRCTDLRLCDYGGGAGRRHAVDGAADVQPRHAHRGRQVAEGWGGVSDIQRWQPAVQTRAAAGCTRSAFT